MAALTRTAARLLGQNRTNVFAALLNTPTRTCFKKSLKEGDGEVVKNDEVSSMMKDRRLRQESIGRSSIEAFMQERMGVKRDLSDEELGMIGGDPNIFEADSEMMEEFVDTIRGDMDTYDQAAIEISEETAKIIGRGTYNDPVLIPSREPERFVICYCEEVDGDAVFMNLSLGERRACNCGNWFQLVHF